MTAVLDASALLAFLHNENGADMVKEILENSAMSTVNWSEVLQKALAQHIATDGLFEELAVLGLSVVPFDAENAECAAWVWKITRKYGLSLGDRACLALGQKLKATVYTTDRIWQEIPPLEDLVIKVIR